MQKKLKGLAEESKLFKLEYSLKNQSEYNYSLFQLNENHIGLEGRKDTNDIIEVRNIQDLSLVT